MTKTEWTANFNAMLNKYPMFKLSKPLSMNELIYMLRMEGNEYNISTVDSKGEWSCIPSAKETFIPTRCLAQKIVNIEFEEDFQNEKDLQDIICLTIHTKEEK